MRKAIVLTLGFVAVISCDQMFAMGPDFDREYVFVSAPMWGNWHTCTYTNLSEDEVEIETALGNEVLGTDVVPGGGSASFARERNSTKYCKFTWIGKKGAIRASHCVSDGFDPYEAVACLEAH